MTAQLAQPLDFLVVSDHSDNLGFFPKLVAGDPAFLANETGKRWYDLVQAGGQSAVKAALELVDMISRGTFPEELSIRPGTESLRDPAGANLDRVQVVKGWMDGSGKRQEKVFDVAWSDTAGRAPGTDGKLPAVGNTVNIEQASYDNSIGTGQLTTIWTDPTFDASQAAFYYLRVLAIPTPRWTAFDVLNYGAEIPAGMSEEDFLAQQRAYSSPIWYTP